MGHAQTAIITDKVRGASAVFWSNSEPCLVEVCLNESIICPRVLRLGSGTHPHLASS